MRRLFVSLGLCTVIALASHPVSAAGGPRMADDDDEDDILAPVRTSTERAPTAVPMKERARKVGLVALIPLGEASKTLADSLTTELTKALDESSVAEVKALALDVGGPRSASDGDALVAAKKAGDEALGRAQQLLIRLQFGKAKKSFESALASYEKAAAVLEGPQPLIDAWLGLAEVAARQAQDDEARRAFAALVALNPEYELDKKRFPGLFLTTHRKVRDQLLKGERAAIAVDETATGASVVVDGRSAKSAPARISGVFPGPHLVRVLRDGLPAWGTVVSVEAGSTAAVSPGFLGKGAKGPSEELAQNKLSPESASVVAEAARKQGFKGGVVGVVSRDGGGALVQLVYVDAASGKVALLPQTKFSPSLLDVSIEALKARSRMDELAGGDGEGLDDADADETLIEGARAGAAVTVAEVEFKYNVKPSRADTSSRRVGGGDDDLSDGGDESGDDRVVAESKTGSRKRIDNDDPYANTNDTSRTVDEDAPVTSQPWFMPTMVTLGVVGGVGVLAGTGAILVATGVLADPRPANGASVNVTLPSSN
jgi:hypothetical protein